MIEIMDKWPSKHRKTENQAIGWLRRKLCSLDGGTGVEFLQTWRSFGNCRFQDPDLRPGSLPPLCRGGLWWRRGWFFVKPATSDAPVTVAATSTASAAAATAAATSTASGAATAAATSTASAAATTSTASASATTSTASASAATSTASAAAAASTAAKLHSNRRFRLHFAAGVPGQARHDRARITYVARRNFKNQWGLTAIRADRAYAQLELEHGAGTGPGSGQTVGLIDTGIDTGHDVFAGKTVSEHFFSGATDETGDRTSHGTAVASVIVGRPSDAFTASVTAGRGVARGADVAMFAIRAGSSSGNYVPISLAGLNGGDNQWASRLNHVINWSSDGRSIDFVNMSAGLQWDYRSIQCTGFARQFRRYDCRARADGRERKDGLRLGRGQRPTEIPATRPTFRPTPISVWK